MDNTAVIKRLEQQIDQPNMEDDYPDEWLKAGAVLGDKAFLAKCEKDRDKEGSWHFQSSIQFEPPGETEGWEWDSPRFKEELATQIWSLAEELARSVGRCRTLVTKG